MCLNGVLIRKHCIKTSSFQSVSPFAQNPKQPQRGVLIIILGAEYPRSWRTYCPKRCFLPVTIAYRAEVPSRRQDPSDIADYEQGGPAASGSERFDCWRKQCLTTCDFLIV